MAKQQTISRRDFLKGAAAGTAMLAGFGLFSACGSDPAEPSPSASPSESPSASPSPSPSASPTPSASQGGYTPGTYSQPNRIS